MIENIAGGFVIISTIFYMIAKSSKEDSIGIMIGNGGLLAMLGLAVIILIVVIIAAIRLAVMSGYSSIFG